MRKQQNTNRPASGHASGNAVVGSSRSYTGQPAASGATNGVYYTSGSQSRPSYVSTNAPTSTGNFAFNSGTSNHPGNAPRSARSRFAPAGGGTCSQVFSANGGGGKATAPPPVSSKTMYPTLSQAFGTSPSPQAVDSTHATPIAPFDSGSFGSHAMAAAAAIATVRGGVNGGSRSLSPFLGADGTPIDMAPAASNYTTQSLRPTSADTVGAPGVGDEPLELDSWDLQLQEEFLPKTPSGGVSSATPNETTIPQPQIFAQDRSANGDGASARVTVLRADNFSGRPQHHAHPVALPTPVVKQPSPVEVAIASVLQPTVSPSESGTTGTAASAKGSALNRGGPTRSTKTTHFSNVSEAASAAPTTFSSKSVADLSLRERVEILVTQGLLGTPQGESTSSNNNNVSTTNTPSGSAARNRQANSKGSPPSAPPPATPSTINQLRGLRKPRGQQHLAVDDGTGVPKKKTKKSASNISCTGTVGTIFREMVMGRPLGSALQEELIQVLEHRPTNPVEIECLRVEMEAAARRKASRKARRNTSPKSDLATRSVDREIRGSDIDRRSGGSNGQFSSDSFGSYATSNTMSTSPSWCFGEQYKIAPHHNFEPTVWDETNRFLPLEVREVSVTGKNNRRSGSNKQKE